MESLWQEVQELERLRDWLFIVFGTQSIEGVKTFIKEEQEALRKAGDLKDGIARLLGESL